MEKEFLKLSNLSKVLGTKLDQGSQSYIVLLDKEYKSLLESKEFQGHYFKEDTRDNTNIDSYIHLSGDRYKFILINAKNIYDIGLYKEI